MLLDSYPPFKQLRKPCCHKWCYCHDWYGVCRQLLFSDTFRAQLAWPCICTKALVCYYKSEINLVDIAWCILVLDAPAHQGGGVLRCTMMHSISRLTYIFIMYLFIYILTYSLTHNLTYCIHSLTHSHQLSRVIRSMYIFIQVFVK